METENEIERIAVWYREVIGAFCERIKLSNDPSLFHHLVHHLTLRDVLSEGFQKCVSKKDRVEASAAKIREFFSKKKNNEIREALSENFFLFKQEEVISRFVAEGTKVFGSNTRPIKLQFDLKDEGSLKIMYKFSDDMRMDQLIIQIFSLMEFLLKALSVDLRLTIYEILVYSGSDGIMKFVDNSDTVQNILYEHNNDLARYLAHRSKAKTERL